MQIIKNQINDASLDSNSTMKHTPDSLLSLVNLHLVKDEWKLSAGNCVAGGAVLLEVLITILTKLYD